MMHRVDPVGRFWAKVDKTVGHGPNGECWVWTAAKAKPWGYGKFSWGHANWIHAHRHSWVMANGEVPDGQWVLHKCDNPSCVRPDHLFLGDCSANVRDMYAKGRNYHVTKPWRLPTGKRSGRHTMPERTARGEGTGTAKLTDDAVRFIRSEYAKGQVSQQSLADIYDVSQAVVSALVLRKTWRHVE